MARGDGVLVFCVALTAILGDDDQFPEYRPHVLGVVLDSHG